jgi:hypothetical protein
MAWINKIQTDSARWWERYSILSSAGKGIGGEIGLFMANYGNNGNVIDAVNVSIIGNTSTYFGELNGITNACQASTSNSVKAFTGGGNYSTTYYINTIQYNTFSTASNATNMGVLTASKGRLAAGGNNTTGLFNGGISTSVIDYLTYATQSNSSSFGNSIASTRDRGSGLSNSEYVWFVGGVSRTDIEKITISTLGSSSSFGNLIQTDYNCVGSTSDFSILGIVTHNRIIEYFNLQTNSNSSTFGNSIQVAYNRCLSNGVRAVEGYSNIINYMGYITMAILSNAYVFGSLARNKYLCSTASGN